MLSSTNKAMAWPLWGILLLLLLVPESHAAPSVQPWQVNVRRLNGDIYVSFDRKLTKPMQLDASNQRSPLPGVDVSQRRVVLAEAQTMLMGSLRMVLPYGSHLQARTLNGTINVSPGAVSVDGYNLNGQLQIRGVTSWVRARTVNGVVQVSQSTAVEASSVSGILRLSQISGRLLANTVSGTIQLQGCNAQHISVRAVSGSLILRNNKIRQLQAKTFSGSISLIGPLGPRAHASLTTASGQVTVQGPLAPASDLTIRSGAGDVLLLWPKAHPTKLSLRAQTGGTWNPPSPSPFQVRAGSLTQVSGDWTPPKANKQHRPVNVSVQVGAGDLTFIWR